MFICRSSSVFSGGFVFYSTLRPCSTPGFKSRQEDCQVLHGRIMRWLYCFWSRVHHEDWFRFPLEETWGSAQFNGQMTIGRFGETVGDEYTYEAVLSSIAR